MASYAEEPRPHSQSSSDAHSHSGSITASEDAYVSDVNSSDTYVSDSEQEEGVVKVKVSAILVYTGYPRPVKKGLSLLQPYQLLYQYAALMFIFP